MPRILFVHNNFPAQFGRLGQYLAQNGWEVAFATQRRDVALAGITCWHYEKADIPASNAAGKTTHSPEDKIRPGPHPYARAYDAAVRTGQRAAKKALSLKHQGYIPDIIMAHSGWGPGLYLKNIWPEAKYVGYFEWYYHAIGADTAFLDLVPGVDQQIVSQARNAPILMDLAQCDLAICPTQWQRRQFPGTHQDQLIVHHDGIDTDYFIPSPDACHEIDGRIYRRGEKIITYVARGMEPYRGFPEFMKALSAIQSKDRDVKAIIVGQDRVAYGKKLKEGDSYKKRALGSLNVDLDRIHFTGTLPYKDYQKVLQVSASHIYLTIPFVLSWSLMEAMSCACPIIASDTDPIQEMIDTDEHALLVDMKNESKIVETTLTLLNSRDTQDRLGANARKKIIDHYKARDIFSQKDRLFRDLV